MKTRIATGIMHAGIVLMFLCGCTAMSHAAADGALRALLTQRSAEVLKTSYPQWKDAVVSVNAVFTERISEQLQEFPDQEYVSVDISCRHNDMPGSKHVMKVVLSHPDGLRKAFYLTVQASAIAPRYVAMRDIQPKEVITADMFRHMPLDIASCNVKLITDLSAIGGKESKIMIRSGEPLRPWMIGPRPAFRKGADVDMVYEEDGVVLRLKGRAVEDGYAGKTIRCYRLNSSKSFKVKVIDERTVLIDK